MFISWRFNDPLEISHSRHIRIWSFLQWWRLIPILSWQVIFVSYFISIYYVPYFLTYSQRTVGNESVSYQVLLKDKLKRIVSAYEMKGWMLLLLSILLNIPWLLLLFLAGNNVAYYARPLWIWNKLSLYIFFCIIKNTIVRFIKILLYITICRAAGAGAQHGF